MRPISRTRRLRALGSPIWFIALLMLGTIGGAVTLSLTSGQTQPPSPTPPSPTPTTPSGIRPVTATSRDSGGVTPATFASPSASQVFHDLHKMPPSTRQNHLIASPYSHS